MDYETLINSLEAASGKERIEHIDWALQELWDADGGSEQFSVEIGNEYHERPVPFTDDLTCAMALAVRLFDTGMVDIEVAHRSIPGRLPFSRAEICGPHVDSFAVAHTPAIAVCIAILRAKEAARRAALQEGDGDG